MEARAAQEEARREPFLRFTHTTHAHTLSEKVREESWETAGHSLSLTSLMVSCFMVHLMPQGRGTEEGGRWQERTHLPTTSDTQAALTLPATTGEEGRKGKTRKRCSCHSLFHAFL